MNLEHDSWPWPGGWRAARARPTAWTLSHNRKRVLNRVVRLSCDEHEDSCCYVDLPPLLAAQVLAYGARIPEDDLAEKGREDQPHVTVAYGCADEQLNALSALPPPAVRLGKVGFFPAGEGCPHDVLYVEVDSSDLENINSALCPDPERPYRPHATVAYLKPGRAERWFGDNYFEGMGFNADRLVCSPARGDDQDVRFRGHAQAHQLLPT